MRHFPLAHSKRKELRRKTLFPHHGSRPCRKWLFRARLFDVANSKQRASKRSNAVNLRLQTLLQFDEIVDVWKGKNLSHERRREERTRVYIEKSQFWKIAKNHDAFVPASWYWFEKFSDTSHCALNGYVLVREGAHVFPSTCKAQLCQRLVNAHH